MKIAIKQNQILCTHSGATIKNKAEAKEKIKEDCYHRCAYCDDYDGHLGKQFYHLEHFAPKKKFPALEFSYDNFLYACPFCNWSKSDKWYSKKHDESISDTKGFINPKDLILYEMHLTRRIDGSIGYKTELGKNIYWDLKLYLPRHQMNFNIDRANDIIDSINDLPIELLDNELRELKIELQSLLLNYYKVKTALNSAQ